ncbi:hypothetical protein FHS27_002340 [Rhodopirellula rubra]|uniref:DUF1559 domain-containing protein n=1 Tax=Aporhodopirellula rubra TaxID=980271 RepID=A0A7W5DXV8_9BACT|nr:DUF1559 domain-containing protein [Aporhodopirellula rubra]MBB3206531.1 hypothetical protein [Aporhodopirellula rubra]
MGVGQKHGHLFRVDSVHHWSEIPSHFNRSPDKLPWFTLVVIAITGVRAGMLLPAAQTTREGVRQMDCSNKFRQIGQGTHNDHSVFNPSPLHGAGPIDYATFDQGGGAAR